MAEKKEYREKSPLIGSQAQPTVLDKTTNIGVDLNKTLADNIIDAGIVGSLDIGELDRFTNVSNSRDQVYSLIDSMCNDSAVSAIVRTYAEDVCEPSDTGNIVWAESDNANVGKYVNYLLDLLDVDKNIYSWAYSLVKYGDAYLRLYRESDYQDALFNKSAIDRAETALSGKTKLNEKLDESVNLNIHKTTDPYAYYVELVADPGTMFELTRFGKTFGYIEAPNDTASALFADASVPGAQAQTTNNSTVNYNYRWKSGDVNIYQADDFVHACLEDDVTRFPETVRLFRNEEDYSTNSKSAIPYKVKRGKSILYDAFKVWREKQLLEGAVLLSRITRSGIVRKVGVEVGDMPKDQVQLLLRRVKEMFEQKTSIAANGQFTEYTNPGAIENFIYYATNNNKGNITVDSVGGDFDPKQLTDLDWWNNKFYGAFGIPKQYFGYCLGKDTPILLLNGQIRTIEYLFNNKDKYIGKGIMACNPDGSLVPTKISNIMLTNEHAKLLRVWLDNGKYVDVTPDHRMMLRNGSFVEARLLKEGDSLMPYYDRIEKDCHMVLDNKTGKWMSIENSQPTEVLDAAKIIDRLVVKIEPFGDDNVVYDITVEADCHTFALPCGIFVHNCEDSAGFNGGTSLSIISSVYARAVKRVQNALIQAITDMINLILINKGLTSYLNNFTIKMKAPLTQEEKDYREDLGNRLNAISNFQSLVSDIETRSTKLTILKDLMATLHYSDDIITELQKEIDRAKEAEEAEAAEKKAEDENNAKTAVSSESTENNTPQEAEEPSGADMNLAPMPDEAAEGEANESFDKVEGMQALTEDSALVEANDDLPSPEEADANKDFTEND